MWRAAAIALALAACGNDREVVTPDPPIPARVRLITDAQYVHAVHDLLGGVDVPAIETPGVGAHEFFHDEIIAVEAPQLVQYRIAAETIARQIAAQPELAPGDPLALAARAFRRPLTAAEHTALAAMAHDGGTPLVIEAVLQAPQFIYRPELGPGALDGYALASELSFLLLDSIPDDPLWAAAGDGSLVREDVLAAQVDRLLALPAVQANLDQAVLDWLEVHRVLEAVKDQGLWPDYTDPLRHAMLEETQAFVHDVLWNRHGSLRELLTSPRTILDARLAPIYGLALDAETPVPVVLDRRERAGVITQATFMTFLATTQRESIIQRGIYIDRHFLCLPEPGRPPITAIVEVSGLTNGLSEAQFGHYRKANGLCASCHTTVDPPGWALEAYDALGRYRLTDANDQAVQDTTEIVLDGARVPVTGGVQLAHALADSAQVQHCVADQFVHHAFGRAVALDLPEVADLDLVELIRTITTSQAFRVRGGPR